jgi:hypothetical protein
MPQRFDYRTARFSVDLPVEYTIENATQTARCIEISKEGITLAAEQPLPADAVGRVKIIHQNKSIELDVRVVHAAGMEFLYKSQDEREGVNQLVAMLAAPSTGLGPLLVT